MNSARQQLHRVTYIVFLFNTYLNILLSPAQRSWRGIYKWVPCVRVCVRPTSFPECNSKTVEDISTKLATHIKLEA